MKITIPCLLGILGTLTILDAVAQSPQPLPPPVKRQRTLIAAPTDAKEQSEAPELLSANYRITFSGTSGDKSLGELTTLTCSPSIQVSGPLNSTEMPSTFQVSGTISEKDGTLLFAYSIGFSVPVVTTAVSGSPGSTQAAQYKYNNHSTTGTLRMVAGEKYEVLKCGGNSYTIVISPEAQK